MRTKQHTVSSAGTNGRGVEMIPIRYKAEGSAVVPSHYLVAPYLLQNQTLLHPDCFLFHPLLIKSHGKSSWAKSYGDVFRIYLAFGSAGKKPSGVTLRTYKDPVSMTSTDHNRGHTVVLRVSRASNTQPLLPPSRKCQFSGSQGVGRK